MGVFAGAAAANLARLGKTRPVIHNITNFVAMSFTANALLAAGASPVMAHAAEEAAEVTASASALVLNMGTPSRDRIAGMIASGKCANKKNIPVVFDPVGAGTTGFRITAAERLMEEIDFRVLRGNASEVLALGRRCAGSGGVDAVHETSDALETALSLAIRQRAVVAVTGREDVVTDGSRVLRVLNGHPLMARITAAGCTVSAVIGAFLAVDTDTLRAAATALAYFGLAGETAARAASAPGSFMVALLDALYTITPEQLEAGCRIEQAQNRNSKGATGENPECRHLHAGSRDSDDIGI